MVREAIHVRAPKGGAEPDYEGNTYKYWHAGELEQKFGGSAPQHTLICARMRVRVRVRVCVRVRVRVRVAVIGVMQAAAAPCAA